TEFCGTCGERREWGRTWRSYHRRSCASTIWDNSISHLGKRGCGERRGRARGRHEARGRSGRTCWRSTASCTKDNCKSAALTAASVTNTKPSNNLQLSFV